MSSKPLHPLDREVSDVIDEILSMYKPLSSIVELESKSLQRETILRAMDFILMDAKSRDLLESALGILDAAMNSTSAYNRCTLRKVISTPSKRFAFVVQGSVSEYVCFWNFCSCRNYFERVKLSGKKAMCKHLLAIRLAPFVLNEVQEEKVPDEQFANSVISRLQC